MSNIQECKTCNDTKQVGEEQHYLGRSVGWKACPDCNDPDVIEKPEQEGFTKRARFTIKDTVLPLTVKAIHKKSARYYIPPDIIENYFEACDIIDRQAKAMRASLPTSMMMCPKCDINYMKPTEDMCDKCRIEILETNLKKRLEADIDSTCVIERMQREIMRLETENKKLIQKYTYTSNISEEKCVEKQLERIIELQSQLKAKDEALQKLLDVKDLWLPSNSACYENPDEARALYVLKDIIEQALTPNSPEGQEVADEMIPR